MKARHYNLMLEGKPTNITIDLKKGEVTEQKKHGRIVHEFDKKMKHSEFKQMLNEIMKGEL